MFTSFAAPMSGERSEPVGSLVKVVKVCFAYVVKPFTGEVVKTFTTSPVKGFTSERFPFRFDLLKTCVI